MRRSPARLGSMALLKTMANSTPMVATTIMAMVNASPSESTPGVAYHNAHEPATPRAVKTLIHGLRRPPASAMEPRNGAKTAMTTPAKA